MDTILVFLPFSRHAFAETLAGVARRSGGSVRIQTVDGPVRAADLAKLLAFWRPRGCIVEASEGLGVFTPERFGRTPVVYLDRTPIDDRRSLLEVRQDYAAAICENEKTPLSSLCPDFEQAGWLCADLLEERIRNPHLRKALRAYRDREAKGN